MLKIDLSAVAANYARICEEVGRGVIVAPAVKADGYGLGVKPVARILYKAGARVFYVSCIEEAIALRSILPDVQIRTLNGYYKGAEDEYAAYDIIPCLCSYEEVSRAAAMAQKTGVPIKSVLHFDTGINRLGMMQDEVQALVHDPKMKDALGVIAVMSHFACADEAAHPMNERQYNDFSMLSNGFKGVTRSLCNSAGIFLDDRYHMQEVRPGMALYGLNPCIDKKSPMRPVIDLSVSILQIKSVDKGVTCGYNATHRFDKNSCIATVQMGYADGFLRTGGQNAKLYWRGEPCRVVGRVSMDLVICDISAVHEGALPQVGDRLEVVGPHQSADDLAHDMGTIGYEVLTALGARYPRQYIGGDETCDE